MLLTPREASEHIGRPLSWDGGAGRLKVDQGGSTRTHTTSGPPRRAARLLLGGGALARYVRTGSIGTVPQCVLKVRQGLLQARGRASTRCTQASSAGKAPLIGRCSASTRWNGSPSSRRSSSTPYFR